MYNDESRQGIVFYELWQIVFQKKYKILIVCVLTGLLSVLYALSLPNIYRSETLLVANSRNGNGSSMSSLVGQFGGLASLAGVTLPNSSLDKTGYALQVLQSREFIYEFIENNNLKPLIFATKGWNKLNNELQFNSEIYDSSKNKWLVDDVSNSEPSLNEVYRVFLSEMLEIKNQIDVATVRIAVKHHSPYVARDLVSKLTTALNKKVKQQDMDDALSSIAYLEGEIKKTNNASAHSMFYQLIEKQYQTLMLTRVQDDYVFKVIDKPVVAEKKESPRRALICVVGVLLGFVLSLIALLTKHFTSQRH